MSVEIGPRTLLERIVSHQGEEYAPKGLVLKDPATQSDWIDAVRDTILPKALAAEKYGQGLSGTAMLTSAQRLHFAARKNKLWWYLEEKGAHVGAGSLIYFQEDKTYGCAYAALFHSRLRGHRLYSRILRVLAVAAQTPIDSSKELKSASALRAWKHMGVFHPARGRFRLTNPARKTPVEWCEPFNAEELARLLTYLST